MHVVLICLRRGSMGDKNHSLLNFTSFDQIKAGANFKGIRVSLLYCTVRSPVEDRRPKGRPPLVAPPHTWRSLILLQESNLPPNILQTCSRHLFGGSRPKLPQGNGSCPKLAQTWALTELMWRPPPDGRGFMVQGHPGVPTGQSRVTKEGYAFPASNLSWY